MAAATKRVTRKTFAAIFVLFLFIAVDADVDAGALDRLQLGRSSSQNPLRLSSGCGTILVLLRQDPARLQGLPVRVQPVEAQLTVSMKYS